MLEKSINFLKESKIELGKVIFPSRQEVINSTSVVILSVVVVSAFLGVVDWVLSKAIAYIVVR
jgi:preprotein translocase subunit SecE